MGSHPINLALRFLLELAALAALGVWGWQYGDSRWLSYLLAVGIPVLAAIIWGVFNVPNDPSRSGGSPIIVPGIIRLAIELALFILATWAVHDLDHTRLSWLFGAMVIMHYLVSYDRIIWLIKQ